MEWVLDFNFFKVLLSCNYMNVFEGFFFWIKNLDFWTHSGNEKSLVLWMSYDVSIHISLYQSYHLTIVFKSCHLLVCTFDHWGMVEPPIIGRVRITRHSLMSSYVCYIYDKFIIFLLQITTTISSIYGLSSVTDLEYAKVLMMLD